MGRVKVNLARNLYKRVEQAREWGFVFPVVELVVSIKYFSIIFDRRSKNLFYFFLRLRKCLLGTFQSMPVWTWTFFTLQPFNGTGVIVSINI